ncbi:hypothetical protein [Paenibacillus methanolicus]|uniref:Uncharacterized protein n=1 Tax=Paenibacillus methanolicus TaxID=582686 RepID=A0A5S5CKB8_9BACL|nr:hypothetical protein [Paenibacillus methanolicus]TYP79175.1 hypothetical protein BCM02_101291 [Paenibacillus methanolicus]
MKKKWMIGTGIGVGAVMLLASGLAASAGTSGYEAYKDAWKQSGEMTSIAGAASFRLTDNGASLFDASTTFKGDMATQAGSANVRMTSGKESHTLNVYHQDGQTVLKKGDSDVYQVVEKDGEDGAEKTERADHAMHGKHAELAENVIDTLVGQLRQQVTLTEGQNGGKQVALHLNSAQIPAPVQAIGSFLITAASSHEEEKNEGTTDAGTVHDLDVDLPELVDDVRVTAINLDANIDKDNYISAQTAEIVVTGKDASGKTHELKAELDMSVTDRDQVVPDRVDLTGKQVETVKPEDAEQHGRGW